MITEVESSPLEFCGVCGQFGVVEVGNLVPVIDDDLEDEGSDHAEVVRREWWRAGHQAVHRCRVWTRGFAGSLALFSFYCETFLVLLLEKHELHLIVL